MMDDRENRPATPEAPTPEMPDTRPAWLRAKEQWYDKLPFTLHQMDIILGVAIGALALVFVIIGLDAAGVF